MCPASSLRMKAWDTAATATFSLADKPPRRDSDTVLMLSRRCRTDRRTISVKTARAPLSGYDERPLLPACGEKAQAATAAVLFGPDEGA